MQQLTLIPLLLFTLFCCAQKQQVTIYGKIIHDGFPVENIHIINLNSETGSVSDADGEFSIVVQENDVLYFSAVQFIPQKITMDKNHLLQKTITVDLLSKINLLEEVILTKDTLSGNLLSDTKILKDTVYVEDQFLEEILAIDYSKPILLNTDEMDRNKPPNADTFANSNVPGGNIMGLIQPAIELVGKIGAKKRFEKQQIKIYENKSKTIVEDIRLDFGDTFFIEKLHIPKNKIDAFLMYCNSPKLKKAYLNDKKLEVIDILLRANKNFDAPK